MSILMLPEDTLRLLIRIAFLIGAITDGLAVLPLLSPRLAASLFGGDSSRAQSPQAHYALRIAAALMAGWTILLFWGAIEPFQRRDLLWITVFPVVAGILAATYSAVRTGMVSRRRMTPLWLHLSSVSVFYLALFILTVRAHASHAP